MSGRFRVAAWSAVAALALLAGGAQAAAQDEPLDCNPNGNQQQMNDCAVRDFRAADATLNIRYGEVMKTLSPQMRGALRNEQRAWLKGRDPACKRAVKANEGGSIWPLVFNACLEKSTRKRTAELDRWKGREQ
ncbi:lysozyme inhibitor LprI family protein [uncultured Variovorax sp.]|uniref:lysozyme inhibitor LprI family protein n=1 Tax=uncultured Variovorax sp. TaxID=114708 RepID=UPI0025E74B87|nr:lysozyme inhibitor LprI family protein [uncultured Variovorax sp.]